MLDRRKKALWNVVVVRWLSVADVGSCVVAALWNVVVVRWLSAVLILAAVLLLLCGMLLWLDG